MRVGPDPGVPDRGTGGVLGDHEGVVLGGHPLGQVLRDPACRRGTGLVLGHRRDELLDDRGLHLLDVRPVLVLGHLAQRHAWSLHILMVFQGRPEINRCRHRGTTTPTPSGTGWACA
jgi:hypothetical protein